jgi:hypothetical protein
LNDQPLTIPDAHLTQTQREIRGFRAIACQCEFLIEKSQALGDKELMDVLGIAVRLAALEADWRERDNYDPATPLEAYKQAKREWERKYPPNPPDEDEGHKPHSPGVVGAVYHCGKCDAMVCGKCEYVNE